MESWKKKLEVISTIIILASLTGCTVADYKEPVSNLDEAINQSVTAVEKIDKKATEAKNQKSQQLVIAGKAHLLAADGTCAIGSDKCSLAIALLDKNGNRLIETYPATSLMPNGLVILNSLKEYVASLNAIVEADTASAVETSTNAALASAAQIEVEIRKAKNENNTASSIEAYSQPTSAAIRWFVVQYIDRVKRDALANATRQAQPVIKELGPYYNTLGEVLTAFEVAGGHMAWIFSESTYSDAVDNKQVNEAAISAFVKATNGYSAILKAGSAKPLEKFVEAHTKLYENLDGESDVTMADVIASINAFEKQAKEFKKIVDDFEKVADEQ